jgi:hypothetical protein
VPEQVRAAETLASLVLPVRYSVPLLQRRVLVLALLGGNQHVDALIEIDRVRTRAALHGLGAVIAAHIDRVVASSGIDGIGIRRRIALYGSALGDTVDVVGPVVAS